MTATEKQVCVGVVTGPHGVRGAVRIKSFTARARGHRRLWPARGRERRAPPRAAARRRGQGRADRAPRRRRRPRPRRGACAGCGSICRARRCRRPRRRSIYHADLIGLDAVLSDGTRARPGARGPRFRRRRHARDRAPGGPPVMVPFTRAVVPVVDLDGRPAGHRPAAGPARRRRTGPPAARGRAMTWRATVLTIFPEMLPGPLGLFAGRQGVATQGCGGSKRWTSATLRAISTARSTTRRSAAGRAW